MKPRPRFPSWLFLTLSLVLLPALAQAHPGHDHMDIPAVIRRPFASVEHVALVAALLALGAGLVVLFLKARRASSHGARPRSVRVR